MDRTPARPPEAPGGEESTPDAVRRPRGPSARRGSTASRLEEDTAAYKAGVEAAVAEVVDDPERGPKLVASAYETAVGYCRELIVRDEMSPQALREVAKRLGLEQVKVRVAHHEAARALRYDSGGILERQEASIASCKRQRRVALDRMAAAVRKSDEWREKEASVLADAARATTPTAKADLLVRAAKLGEAASRAGLEAEKWQMSALMHQRHLDSVQCLVGPRELHLHGGADGLDGPGLEQLGAALRGALVRLGRADVAGVLGEALALVASGE